MFVEITANQVSFQDVREFNKIMMILGVITDAKGTMPDSQGRQVIRPVCTHRPTLHAFQGSSHAFAVGCVLLTWNMDCDQPVMAHFDAAYAALPLEACRPACEPMLMMYPA